MSNHPSNVTITKLLRFFNAFSVRRALCGAPVVGDATRHATRRNGGKGGCLMLDRHDADPSAFRSRRRHSEMRESLSTTNRQRNNDMTQDRVLDGLLGPLTVAAWDGTAEERWATQQQVFAGYVLLRALADAPTVEAASQRAVPGAAAHRLRRWHAPARPGHHEERRRACRVRDAGDQAPPRRAAGPGRRPPAHDGAHRALPVPAPDRAPPAGGASGASGRPGRRRARRLACRAGCSTTYGAPPCATWSARACPAPWQPS